jgi:acetyl-CoA synthetase
MSAASLYPVRPEVLATTLTDEATYKAMYQQSVVNPDGFWREQAQRLDWIKPFTLVKQTSFDDHHVDIKWFADGTLNVSYNCLDRHLAERGDQIAIIWEGDDPSEHRNITTASCTKKSANSPTPCAAKMCTAVTWSLSICR